MIITAAIKVQGAEEGKIILVWDRKNYFGLGEKGMKMEEENEHLV